VTATPDIAAERPLIQATRALLSDFAKLEIREEIRPKVLKGNARRLLGI
jgi:predicted TIM-barrel fold metal-dependent hydrolase